MLLYELALSPTAGNAYPPYLSAVRHTSIPLNIGAPGAYRRDADQAPHYRCICAMYVSLSSLSLLAHSCQALPSLFPRCVLHRHLASNYVLLLTSLAHLANSSVPIAVATVRALRELRFAQSTLEDCQRRETLEYHRKYMLFGW